MTHSLVVSIVVTFVTLEWLEARRLRNARPRRARGERCGPATPIRRSRACSSSKSRAPAHKEEDSVRSLVAALVGLVVAVSDP